MTGCESAMRPDGARLCGRSASRGWCLAPHHARARTIREHPKHRSAQERKAFARRPRWPQSGGTAASPTPRLRTASFLCATHSLVTCNINDMTLKVSVVLDWPSEPVFAAAPRHSSRRLVLRHPYYVARERAKSSEFRLSRLTGGSFRVSSNDIVADSAVFSSCR